MSGYIGTVIDTDDLEAVKKVSLNGEMHTQITVYVKKSVPGYSSFYCAVHEIEIPEKYRDNNEESLEMRALLLHMAKRDYPGKNVVVRFETLVDAKSLDESTAYYKAFEYLNDIKESGVRRYLTAYAVTRHYGGPEEGGWWYNRYDPIESVPLPEELHIPDVSKELEEQLDGMKMELEAKHLEIVEGNIYSMLGGTELSIITEPIPNSNQTMGTPIYE